jgi:hypothetical protein
MNIPTLVNLGVPAMSVLKEVVRVLNLPEDFITDAEQNIAQLQAQQQQMAQANAVEPTQTSPEEAIANAGTGNIRQFLREEG